MRNDPLHPCSSQSPKSETSAILVGSNLPFSSLGATAGPASTGFGFGASGSQTGRSSLKSGRVTGSAASAGAASDSEAAGSSAGAVSSAGAAASASALASPSAYASAVLAASASSFSASSGNSMDSMMGAAFSFRSLSMMTMAAPVAATAAAVPRMRKIAFMP